MSDTDISDVEDHQQFGAMGLDSVAAVFLTVALEKAFKTTLPDWLRFQHQSINEVVAYLDTNHSVGEEFTIGLAKTKEQREAVYRFRYTVYVEEMKRPQLHADHERRRITDPLDTDADIFVLWQNNQAVGTVRVNPLRRNSLDQYRQIYGIMNLTDAELAATSISTRIMLAPHVRQSPVGARMLKAAFDHGRQLGIRFDYCDCNDPVLSFFEQIGYRSIRRVQHPEYGSVTVMKLNLKDTEYLKAIRSPLVVEGRQSNAPGFTKP